MKRIILSIAFLSAPLWGSGITNPSTFTGGTITTPIEAASGSAGAPSYSYSSSTQTGAYYAVNGGTNSLVYSVNGKIVGYWQLQNGTDGGHQNPEGYRPILWIGPGIISSTYTQLGEGLNVWGDTDGGGSQAQIDIVANNIGHGDARLLAQASMADTPNTVIGYLAAYGLGHINDPYYTNGPQRAGAVSVIFQAPFNNVFEFTTSSQTWFYNENTTHAAYHFAHGSSGSSLTDDITFLDNKITVGTVTFSPSTAGILGTTAGDNAGSTFVGEYISSTSLNYSCSPSNRVDMAAIALTPGDWDITGIADTFSSNATFSPNQWDLAISTTSGNNSTGLTEGVNWFFQYVVANVATTITVPVRATNSSSFTYYLKARCLSTGGNTPVFNGTISARRRR